MSPKSISSKEKEAILEARRMMEAEVHDQTETWPDVKRYWQYGYPSHEHYAYVTAT
jgi:hypothetical protein